MCTSLGTVHIPTLVLEISDAAFDHCDRRRLSLVLPQEISDFMSANNIDWWNRGNIHNHVLTFSYLQTDNILARLSSMQSFS